MRRLAAPVRGAMSTIGPVLAGALLLALVLAPAVLADDNDPRCADWKRNGAPPGVDMAVMCPGSGLAIGDLPLGEEPLVPYIVGLLVMAVVLGAVGLLAMRLTARPRRGLRPDDLWSCPACGTTNQPSRASCYACGVSRESAAASGATPPA
ncbi:MAG TPA: zinc finger Ran-binding domain-containing protein [Candidatus Limnocylindrales bacterium]|jgi:hypothetical protein